MARVSPPESATLFSLGYKKRGNDGRMWKIVEDKNGRKRWQSQKPRRKSQKSRRKSQKPRRKSQKSRRKSQKPRRKSQKSRRKSSSDKLITDKPVKILNHVNLDKLKGKKVGQFVVKSGRVVVSDYLWFDRRRSPLGVKMSGELKNIYRGKWNVRRVVYPTFMYSKEQVGPINILLFHSGSEFDLKWKKIGTFGSDVATGGIYDKEYLEEVNDFNWKKDLERSLPHGFYGGLTSDGEYDIFGGTSCGKIKGLAIFY